MTVFKEKNWELRGKSLARFTQKAKVRHEAQTDYLFKYWFCKYGYYGTSSKSKSSTQSTIHVIPLGSMFSFRMSRQMNDY